MIETVAVIELLLERWYEPPTTGRLHLSTLVQQLMSLIDRMVSQGNAAEAAQRGFVINGDDQFTRVLPFQFPHHWRGENVVHRGEVAKWVVAHRSHPPQPSPA